jgi:predicted nucleic acid-binding protein
VKLLLDADVLIGALDSSDAHHRDARTLLVGARERQDSLMVSAVNLTEVLIAPAAHAARLAAAREAIAALGVVIHQPSEAISVDAARLRGRHPISLPDAFLLASARSIGAAIATFDQKVKRSAAREGLTVT